jgi:uncharacterized coiled-coil DUF342 family protein
VTEQDNKGNEAAPVELTPEEELLIAAAPEAGSEPEPPVASPAKNMEQPVTTSPLTTDVEELFAKLEIVKREVQDLKIKVAAANKKKEITFQKKQELSKEIGEKIGGLLGSKKERNTITGEVRELKKERDRLNKEIREKVDEIKKLSEEHKDVLAKFDYKNSPDALLHQIELLEFKMETQPMSFDAEQKLTKKVKELKKEYNLVKETTGAITDIRERSKEIDRLKREANKFHRQVQEHAQHSQEKHEVLVTESKEIDDLKKKEEELYSEFLVEKNAYNDVSQQLKEKLAELQAIKDGLNKQNVRLKEDQKKEEMKTLKDRAKEAEQKVKDRKKLTTEDILALQGLK